MIITLTPNPSLDLLFAADRLVWDDANRVPMPRRRPGGQGINLVRALRALAPEVPAHAIAPLGGRVGDEIRDLLETEQVPLTAIPIQGDTRLFVGARERETGRSLLLNPGGPHAGAGLATTLLEAVAEALSRADRSAGPVWVVCCGSLLPGLPDDFYAQVGRLARRQGARFVPDCDGEPLRQAAGEADLLVPNDMELQRLTGRAARTPGDVVRKARGLLADRGVGRVVVTLGARGAVLVTPSGSWRACPHLPEGLLREVENGSAVGAGDALLAALLATGDPVDGDTGGSGAAGAPDSAATEGLRDGVATGTAVLLGRGATLVDRADVARVRAHVQVTRVQAY